MRYSISNAIPHNPKSEKHPYENLVKSRVYELLRSGAGGGTRTHTPLRITDFESGTSAKSITPAHNAVYYTVMLQKNQVFCRKIFIMTESLF